MFGPNLIQVLHGSFIHAKLRSRFHWSRTVPPYSVNAGGRPAPAPSYPAQPGRIPFQPPYTPPDRFPANDPRFRPPPPGFGDGPPDPPSWTKKFKPLGYARGALYGLGLLAGWKIGTYIFGDPFDPFDPNDLVVPTQAEGFAGYNICGTAGNTNPTAWYDCGQLNHRFDNETFCNSRTWFLFGSGSCADLNASFPSGNYVSGQPSHIREGLFGKTLTGTTNLLWAMYPRAWVRTAGAVGDAVYNPGRDPGEIPGISPNPFPRPGSPQPGTSPVPNYDPFTVPPNAPGPLPAAPPYVAPKPLPLPGSDPAHGPRYWPGSRPRPSPRPRPFSPSPGVEVIPEPGPGQGPTVIVSPVGDPLPGAQPGPGPAPRPNPRPDWKHQDKPPPKGEPERKIGGKAGAAAAAAGAIMGAATEGQDLLDAAWGALRGNGGWQTKKPGEKTSPYQKAVDVGNALSDPDFNVGGWAVDFAQGAAANEIEDAVIGGVGRGLGAASKKGKPHGDLPFGYGLGPAL